VFEKRILRRIFVPKRDEVIGEWRKLHNEVLHDLYFSPNIIRLIEWRKMRWVENVERMGEEMSRGNDGTYHHYHVTSQARIVKAVKNIDAPMLMHVWQELKYRIDMCRVTCGAHIEHL
jgi:hypothetical protein